MSKKHVLECEHGRLKRQCQECYMENEILELMEHKERLTAIATKHATRADELYEALETVLLVLEGKTEFHPDEISIESVRSVLDKSRIEAEE